MRRAEEKDMSARLVFVNSGRHARAIKLQSEAKRIIHFKISNGVVFDRISALKALAFIRSCAPPGWLYFGKRKRGFQWAQINAYSLESDAYNCHRDFRPTQDEIANAIEQVCRWRARHGNLVLKGQTLGKLLDLSEDERADQKVTSIVAKDDTPEAKRARRLLGWRTRKAIVRQAEGRIPRSEYEQESLSKSKPWELEGISRRTWERRRAKADASVSPSVYKESTQGERLASAQAEREWPCNQFGRLSPEMAARKARFDREFAAWEMDFERKRHAEFWENFVAENGRELEFG
jgi:hypothetical protein